MTYSVYQHTIPAKEIQGKVNEQEPSYADNRSKSLSLAQDQKKKAS